MQRFARNNGTCFALSGLCAVSPAVSRAPCASFIDGTAATTASEAPLTLTVRRLDNPRPMLLPCDVRQLLSGERQQTGHGDRSGTRQAHEGTCQVRKRSCRA